MVENGFDFGTFEIDDCCIISEGVSEHEIDSTLGDYHLFESGCYEIPNFLTAYIDTEKFGRDLQYEGTYLLTESGILFEYCG